MIQWKCFELHAHTLNSDGNFSVAELTDRAKDFLYDAVALTDHNTMSGLDELNGRAPAIPLIPGIEWTTYYGHMVVIGADKYVDWRFARPDTIDEYTLAVKEAGGVIGIAHPFELGSPMCTGCYWDFKVRNWKNIDYIEVWSNPSPQKRLKNEIAFKWWTDLLDRGHRLAASAGWDWHRMEDKPVLPAATWLGLEAGEINTETVKEALVSGRTIVSIGPFPDIRLSQGGRFFYPGETLKEGPVSIAVSIDENRRGKIRTSFGIRTGKICIVHNGRIVKSVSRGPGGDFAFEETLELAPGWVRLEGYGDLEGEKNKLLFFSSPWYICSD